MDGRLALSRGLSPACCKVLIALMMAGAALDVAALETWTGLQRQALGRALNVLKRLGLVVPQTGAHNRQTWVPAAGSFFSALQLSHNVTTSLPPPPPIGRNSVDKEEEEDIKPQLSQNTPTGIDRELREAFLAAGIGPGAWSRLAGLDGVTAQRVRWIHDDTRARHRGENVTGLVVRRLLDGDPMPEGAEARQEARIPEPPPLFTRAVPMPPDLPRPVIKRRPRLSDLTPGGVALAPRTSPGAGTSVPPERHAAGTTPGAQPDPLSPGAPDHDGRVSMDRQSPTLDCQEV